MTRIKICGITNIDDALMSIDAGADALGFNFVPDTPRYLKDTKAAAKIIEQLPPFITTVGLFVNADPELIQSIADECHLDMLQLHGDESPQFCQGFNRRVIKAVRIKDESSCSHLSDYRVSGYLLDTYVKGALGGTGVAFDWQSRGKGETVRSDSSRRRT